MRHALAYGRIYPGGIRALHTPAPRPGFLMGEREARAYLDAQEAERRALGAECDDAPDDDREGWGHDPRAGDAPHACPLMRSAELDRRAPYG